MDRMSDEQVLASLDKIETYESLIEVLRSHIAALRDTVTAEMQQRVTADDAG